MSHERAVRLPPAPVHTRRGDGVRPACRAMGVHHSTYYRLKAKVDRWAFEALRIRERRRPRMPNQLGPHLEQRVIAFALGHPGLGPPPRPLLKRLRRAPTADDPRGVLAPGVRALARPEDHRPEARPRRVPRLLPHRPRPYRAADEGPDPGGYRLRARKTRREVSAKCRYILGLGRPERCHERRPPSRSLPSRPWWDRRSRAAPVRPGKGSERPGTRSTRPSSRTRPRRGRSPRGSPKLADQVVGRSRSGPRGPVDEQSRETPAT